MRKLWEIKQRTDKPEILDIYLYDDVSTDYYDWFGNFHESETSAKAFRDELASRPEVKEINLYINSYGGDVAEGTTIYSQLKRHSAHKTAYIDGFACSIASVIAMACDEIVMPRNTMMCIHNMWRRACGNAAELRKAADDLDTINNAGRQAYLEKAGDKLSEDKLVEMMDAETWLTAAQCIEYGLADRFADEEADLTAANQMLEKATAAMNQKLQANRCIAAQLKELARPAEKPAEPEIKPENSVKKMLSGLFA